MLLPQVVYSKLTDLLPSAITSEDDPELQRPSMEEIEDTTEKTRQALEKLTQVSVLYFFTSLASCFSVLCQSARGLQSSDIYLSIYHAVIPLKGGNKDKTCIRTHTYTLLSLYPWTPITEEKYTSPKPCVRSVMQIVMRVQVMSTTGPQGLPVPLHI